MKTRFQRATTAILVLASGLGGCDQGRGKVRLSSRPSARAVKIAWSGCAVVRSGPRCELGADRKLTLWARGDELPRWTFRIDGSPVRYLAAEPMQGGWRLTFEVPARSKRLTVAPEGTQHEAWALVLGDATRHADIDGLVQAGKRGDERAPARLREDTARGDGESRALAEAGYGRVMLARGDMREAEPALRRALAADREQGRVSDEMLDGSALIWALAVLQQRFADARTVLASLESARDQYPEGQARYAYNAGLLAAETYDLRGALASYRTANQMAERLARTSLSDATAEDLARILTMLGRASEALSILEKLPPRPDPCANASLMINRVDALLEVESRNPGFGGNKAAAILLEEQRAARACLDPHRDLIVAVHAARQALTVKDEELADNLAQRLQGPSRATDAVAQSWRTDLLGAWSLARRRPREALKNYLEEGAIARAAGLRNEAFRSEVGAGEALLALGQRNAGIDHLKAAQLLLERTFDGIPLMEGRGEFLSSHDQAVRHLVDALVDNGSIVEAMNVARVAHATEIRHAAKVDRLHGLTADQRERWDDALAHFVQVRRTIEEEGKEDWKLSADQLLRVRADRQIKVQEGRDALDSAYRLLVEPTPTSSWVLRPPDAGDVHVVFFPGAAGWLAFARSASRVRVHRFEDRELASPAAAAHVLDQLSPVLLGARRVRIVAFGRASRMDWHAVRWRGVPLIATVEVEYGLDLADARENSPGIDARSGALLVSDPTGDLRGADREGDLVARKLAAGRVVRLDGGRATRDAFLTALPQVRLLHYAGHSEMADRNGASGTLILAEGARVQIGDLLSLPRLPEVVVLSSCRAAATRATADEDESDLTVGLAQAFIAAGASAVVASTEDVGDADAESFVAAIYEGLNTGGDVGIAKRFRQAAMQAIGRSAQSFRLIVR